MRPLLILLIVGSTARAADWTKLPSLPDPEGFAGSFAGVSHGALLVAGGANFPDKKPWEGGTKTWTDRVFVLEKPAGEWKLAGQLPRPLGYGVSVSHRDGVVCVGGSNADGHFADAFRLAWTDGKLVTTRLPALPKPLANSCGALVGDTLFVAGGQEKPTDAAAVKTAYAIDLSAAVPQWKRLDDCPGRGRMLAAAASFDGAFYLIGGVDHVAGAKREYLKDAYRFVPGQGWKRIADLPQAVAAAPTPAPADATGFFLLGGDDGSQVGVAPVQHRGFSKNILRYDPKADAWTAAGELAAPRVTAPCVTWNKRWVVPGGEVRPGVRSPEVWAKD